MERTKVTDKFQVTIPKEVREKIGLKAGEIMIVEIGGNDEIKLKRFRNIKEPLKILIGEKVSRRHIPVEELEEKMES